MAYFETEDVRDSLLKGILKQEDIDESTAYIDDLSQRLEVSPTRIPNPPPFQIKTLAMCYALMVCAGNKSMMNGDGGENGADAWELKRRIYAKRVDELEPQITAQTLTGGTSSTGRMIPINIPFGRS
jgi:hypothetical protein